MKKLLALVVTAIGIIAGYKKTIAEQKAEIERLNKLIEDEDFDDAERDAKLSELEGFEAEANTKAEDLAALLADEPSVPTVHPETFEVISQPTESLGDLAVREHQSEASGASASVPSVPVVPPPAEEEAGETGEKGEHQGDDGDADDNK